MFWVIFSYGPPLSPPLRFTFNACNSIIQERLNIGHSRMRVRSLAAIHVYHNDGMYLYEQLFHWYLNFQLSATACPGNCIHCIINLYKPAAAFVYNPFRFSSTFGLSFIHAQWFCLGELLRIVVLLIVSYLFCRYSSSCFHLPQLCTSFRVPSGESRRRPSQR